MPPVTGRQQLEGLIADFAYISLVVFYGLEDPEVEEIFGDSFRNAMRVAARP